VLALRNMHRVLLLLVVYTCTIRRVHTFRGTRARLDPYIAETRAYSWWMASTCLTGAREWKHQVLRCVPNSCRTSSLSQRASHKIHAMLALLFYRVARWPENPCNRSLFSFTEFLLPSCKNLLVVTRQHTVYIRRRCHWNLVFPVSCHHPVLHYLLPRRLYIYSTNGAVFVVSTSSPGNVI
jgi:hypothetical protein